jgi:predicted dienelactone hydrolase
VAAGESSYPVVIFSAGRGGFRQESTHLFEELASHGTIVAAMDQPYASSGVVFPDGRLVTIDPRLLPGPTGGIPADPKFFEEVVIPYLARDVSFTLDQLAVLNQADPNGILTGRLDLQRAGMLGPSLGGLVGAEASYQDPRLRALVAMDVHMPADVVRAGLAAPAMFITREARWMELEKWTQDYIDELQTTVRTVYNRLPGDGYLVLVPGMFHANYSDAPLFSPLLSRLGVTGPIEAIRSTRILDAYTLAFFDRHLKGQPAALLDGPSAEYPEVKLETRRRR